jgi:Fe-S cluster biosynthesis and repair protein YggX
MGKWKYLFSLEEKSSKWLGLHVENGQFKTKRAIMEIISTVNSLYSLSITNMRLDKKKKVIEAVLIGVLNFNSPWIIMRLGT